MILNKKINNPLIFQFKNLKITGYQLFIIKTQLKCKILNFRILPNFNEALKIKTSTKIKP